VLDSAGISTPEIITLDNEKLPIGDLFSVDRKTGAYDWPDSGGREVCDAACKAPDLTN